VSRGILLALLAAGLSACLVPQSVDADNTKPHTVPVIDLSSLPSYFLAPTTPLYKQTQDDKTQQCRCQLQLQIPVVNDDDPTVDLQARWYIDYDLGTPQSQLPASTEDIPGSFTTTGRSRTGPRFVFDADALGLNVGPHVIEVVIAERQGFVGDLEQNVSFPHRSLVSGFEGTTFKFVADVKDSAPGVTQCDRNTPLRSPPLTRSCAQ
jgi:hypothetical protein